MKNEHDVKVLQAIRNTPRKREIATTDVKYRLGEHSRSMKIKNMN